MKRLSVRVAGLVAAMVVVGSGACGGPTDVRSIADFDANPCALFTDAVMSQIVAAPYHDLAQVDPTLKKAEKSTSGDDTFACVYFFEAKGQTQVPQVSTMTVTIAHAKTGSQPFAVCSAGAQTKAQGYRTEKIGDQACLSPSSDLWMKVGDNYYHVVVVPQPGFPNPVEANTALSPLLLTVAQGLADRLPRS